MVALMPLSSSAQPSEPVEPAQPSKPDKPNEPVKRVSAIVVVYSYTGNTKAVADLIVERFGADLVRIEAPKYEKFLGEAKASLDAWTKVRQIDITPGTVDFSQYDLIFLGSPIWWFRPAVPLWAFVEKNDFMGRPVVLFNTFNGKFKQKHIDEFMGLVNERGGVFTDHVYVRRGAWFNQLSRDELLTEFSNLLDERQEGYKGSALPEQ